MKLVILCLMLFSIEAIALSPPKPFQGSPHLLSKEFTLGVGEYEFLFKFPVGWGIGEMISSAQKGEARFKLFPVGGGNGCSVEAVRYNSQEDLDKEMARLSKTFKTVKQVQDGFEAQVDKAYYSCRSTQLYLVQIWYPFGKTKDANKIWASLKNCMTIEYIMQIEEEFTPLKEIRHEGWVCNHPDNKLHVLFKCYPTICTPNSNKALNYAFDFKSYKEQGFFYISWDQTNLKTKLPYAALFEKMRNDLKTLGVNQTYYSKDPEFDLENGYAIWEGSQYRLLIVSGDDYPFLFGFAVKPDEFRSRNYDLNDLVKKVRWWKD